jgi:hypothetical protein
MCLPTHLLWIVVLAIDIHRNVVLLDIVIGCSPLTPTISPNLTALNPPEQVFYKNGSRHLPCLSAGRKAITRLCGPGSYLCVSCAGGGYRSRYRFDFYKGSKIREMTLQPHLRERISESGNERGIENPWRNGSPFASMVAGLTNSSDQTPIRGR